MSQVGILLKNIKPKTTRTEMKTIILNEQELANDYPVHWNYLYVVDGKVIRSDVKGTVATLKRDLRSLGKEANVIMNCDIEGRRKLLNTQENEN